MSKKGTIEEIKEYNKNKQAWSRAKKKGLSLTWEEYCQEKSLTHLLELKRDVKPPKEICQTSLNEQISNLVECQTSDLSNLTSDNYVKPKPNLSNLESVKPVDKSLTSIECQTIGEVVKPYTELEKKLIAENKCSTYEFDREKKINKCFTCSYHSK